MTLLLWLSQNIEALNEVIDFEILNVETEKSTGTFSVEHYRRRFSW